MATPVTLMVPDPVTGVDKIVGSGGGLSVTPAQTSAFTPSQVAMSTTAGQIAAADVTSKFREFKNFGTQTVFMGPTSGVTATTGYPLLPNESFSPPWTAATFGITASGTSTVGVVASA